MPYWEEKGFSNKRAKVYFSYVVGRFAAAGGLHVCLDIRRYMQIYAGLLTQPQAW